MSAPFRDLPAAVSLGAEDELLERAADVARRLAAVPPPAPARGGDGPLFARKDDR